MRKASLKRTPSRILPLKAFHQLFPSSEGSPKAVALKTRFKKRDRPRNLGLSSSITKARTEGVV